MTTDERQYSGHLRCTRVWRVAMRARGRGVPLVPGLLWWVIRVSFGAELPLWKAVPEGVVLMHNGAGVVIHPDVRFRGRAVVFHHVTLGNSWGSHEGAPTVGSDVVIGAGAAVLGAVVLGDGCMVAANALVTRDVPAGHLAIGNPAQNRPLPADHVRDLIRGNRRAPST